MHKDNLNPTPSSSPFDQSPDDGSTSIYTTGNIFAFSPPQSRLLSCKKSCVIVRCEGCRVTIAIPERCKSRFCLDCAKYFARRNKKVLTGILKERDLYPEKNEQPRERLRFFTSTCKNFPGSQLEDGLDSMNLWFSKFLRRKITARVIKDTIAHVKDNPDLMAKEEKRYQHKGGWDRVYWNFEGKRLNDIFKGGLKRFEITKGLDSNYHLHIHTYYEGEYIPQPVVNQIWCEIVNKDGWLAEVTDIRQVKNVRKGIKEICKYAFKPDSLTMDDKIFLDDIFKNRKLYSYFGEWFKMLRPGDIDYLIGDEPLTCPCCGGSSFIYDGVITVSDMTDRWVWEDELGLWLFYPDDYLRNQGWSTFDELE